MYMYGLTSYLYKLDKNVIKNNVCNYTCSDTLTCNNLI